jgi:GDP-L-fucose synthase
MPIKKNSKIFIAGHKGMVGSAIYNKLSENNFNNLIVRSRRQLDLMDQKSVYSFFKKNKVDYVILCAAKVGGIYANSSYPAEFMLNNLLIQTNVIDAAYKNKVKRFIFIGSSCIYPKHCLQPIKEEYWLSGNLEPTNRAMATSKIAGIEMCRSYNNQYLRNKLGTQYIALMPTNLYGPNDNYDLDNSHVLPALIRKFHEAKEKNKKKVVLWGTGKIRREFMYSEDLADACIFVLRLSEKKIFNFLNESNFKENPPIINIGVGTDLTINELACKISKLAGFSGKIIHDLNMPDGTPKKLLDVTLINKMGWKAKTSLKDGLIHTYNDFCKKHKL